MSPKRRRLVRRAVSEYLREAAVLVGVFGLLEDLLKANPTEALHWRWILTSLGFSAGLFALGIYFELDADDQD
jgi:hypothetical protein